MDSELKLAAGAMVALGVATAALVVMPYIQVRDAVPPPQLKPYTSAQLRGRQVYIANTLKCRPPRNRNPEPSELAQCEPYLDRQIALVQPKIILAMGRFAVQSLLRSSEPIGKLRGRVHQYQGVPLIVTYHPAYLLRNLPDKARAWEDLCLARETLRLQSGS